METNEKSKAQNQHNLYEWLELAYRLVAIVVMTFIIYGIGSILGILENINVYADLLISFPIAIVVYIFYILLIPFLLTRPCTDGMKHMQAGEYVQALDAFRQFYDMYEQNPGREWLHEILMLKVGSYRPRELALNNQAAVYVRLKNGPKAIRCYEQCLALNSQNRSALVSLNLAAVFTGGEIRSAPQHLSLLESLKWRWRTQPIWRIYLSFIVFMFPGVCCLIPFLAFIASQLQPANAEGPMTLAAIVGTVIAILLVWLVNRYITSLFLKDYYRGERLYRKHQYHEGVQAFRRQAAFFRESTWIIKWPWLYRTRPSTYNYLEWTLLWLAYGYIQLGEGDQLLPIYQQVLDLNPNNEMAQTNINFINLFRENE